MKRLILGLALAACGGGESPPPQISATYSIASGRVTCDHASTTNEFDTSGLRTYDCIWDCATYGGQADRYVDLTFRDDGTTWVLDSEFVSTGICR